MVKLKPLYSLFGIVLGLAAVAGYVAYRTRRVPTPRRRWRRFRRPGTTDLSPADCKSLQGIYLIDKGAEFFGESAVAKCSYTVERGRTVYHLSFFCQKNGTYFICEGRRNGTTILLSGHWRKAAANGAGLVRLVIEQGNGDSNWVLSGMYGDGNKKPDKPLALYYQDCLPQTRPFEIIGHRGAARNVDFLPVSENSIESIKMAARLGATGVEIDVRVTKDGVPVIFHDSFLSVHTTRGPLYGGLIHNYTLRELKQIRLRKGGVVPTLDECLHTALHKTPLQTIWLDIKKECDLKPVQQLILRYTQQALAMGRNFSVYMGIPDETVLACFKKLDNYRDTPSLTELSPDIAQAIGANVWAPQYISGFQRQNVEKVQAAGCKAFVWSLDSEFLVDLFITKGGFDGLVTNTPAVVAHWHYTQYSKAAAAEKKQPA